MRDTIYRYFSELYTFYYVADFKSFTNASKFLGMSKLQTSRDISKLEAFLDLKILNRTTRNVSMTNDGRKLFKQVEQLLEFANDTSLIINSIKNNDSPLFRITMPESLGYWLAPKIISTLPKELSKARFDFNLNNKQIDLNSNAIDFAIKVTNNVNENLYGNLIGTLDEGLYCSKKLLKSKKLVNELNSIAHIESLPFISTGETELDYCEIIINDNNAYSIRFKSQINTTNFQLTKEMCLLGIGVARLPSFLIKKEIDNGSLVRVLSMYTLNSPPIYLIYTNKKIVNPLSASFKSLLINLLKKESITRQNK